ncbi:hypothetical protein L6164_016706 [Bauhinia variegata]|uniref:Uncharacterized protein n=1 Tax=Bauhinia variegata TaxID=167791 RepID=A0ACB9N5J3_BAUVA|nr:hypothetical protein L6164_016706 [Bauhinia variegata]
MFSSETSYIFSHGSINRIFWHELACLVLIDYDDGQTVRFLRMGQFSVNLIIHTTSPITMAACTIDGFNLPLTVDSLIVHVARHTFVIAMPSILYGIQFPSTCDESTMDSLQNIFTMFGQYKNLYERVGGYPFMDDEFKLWSKVRPLIQPMAHEILSRFGHVPGRSRLCISNEGSCFLRVVSMSAATRLMVNSIVNGILEPADIIIKGTNSSPDKPFGASSSELEYDPAYASVTVFSCLVDAYISLGVPHLIDVEPPLHHDEDMGFKYWRFTGQGLMDFIQKVKALQLKQVLQENKRGRPPLLHLLISIHSTEEDKRESWTERDPEKKLLSRAGWKTSGEFLRRPCYTWLVVIARYRQRIDGLSTPGLPFGNLCLFNHPRHDAREFSGRKHARYHPSFAVLSGASLYF